MLSADLARGGGDVRVILLPPLWDWVIGWVRSGFVSW